MFGLATNFPVEFRRLVFVLRLEAEKSHKIHAVSWAQWDVLAKDRMTDHPQSGRAERDLSGSCGQALRTTVPGAWPGCIPLPTDHGL